MRLLEQIQELGRRRGFGQVEVEAVSTKEKPSLYHGVSYCQKINGKETEDSIVKLQEIADSLCDECRNHIHYFARWDKTLHLQGLLDLDKFFTEHEKQIAQSFNGAFTDRFEALKALEFNLHLNKNGLNAFSNVTFSTLTNLGWLKNTHLADIHDELLKSFREGAYKEEVILHYAKANFVFDSLPSKRNFPSVEKIHQQLKQAAEELAKDERDFIVAYPVTSLRKRDGEMPNDTMMETVLAINIFGQNVETLKGWVIFTAPAAVALYAQSTGGVAEVVDDNTTQTREIIHGLFKESPLMPRQAFRASVEAANAL